MLLYQKIYRFCVLWISITSYRSLDKDNPSFEFDDKHVVIVKKRRSRIKYRFCEPTMIVLPPEKDFVMPAPEIKFTLVFEDFDGITSEFCFKFTTYCKY